MRQVRDDFREQMAKASEDLDAWTRANLGPDPETMGTATQILYGLANTLPEIVLLMSGAGAAARLAFGAASAGFKVRTTQLAVGSALFGSDLGVAERNRLVNEGVDKDTAFKAGMISAGLNTIGVMIPPFLGASRIQSAIYGATSNVGLNYAEIKTIQTVLENQNYNELAQQYQLGLTDSTVSGVLGAVMGAAFWRSPTQVKFDRAYNRLYDRYRSDIAAGGKFTKEQSSVNADINSRAVISLAKMSGISPDKIDGFAAKIVWSEDRKTFSAPSEYLMPITQGREWRYGDNASQNPDKKIKITIIEKNDAEIPNNKGLSKILTLYRGEDAPQLINEGTGWRFSIGRREIDEIIHGISKTSLNKEDRLASAAILENLSAVVREAFLAESYRDIKAAQGVSGRDPELRGIHRFYSPVTVNGKNYLARITVRDRVSDGGKKSRDKLSAYQIVGVAVEKTQPSAESYSKRSGVSAEEPLTERNHSDNESLEKLITPHDARVGVTVRNMLTGVKREGDVFYIQEAVEGGKTHWVKDGTRRTRFFEGEPNKEALAENGGYWNDPNEFPQEVYQIGYHGSPYLFDAFTLAHIGSGEGAQAHGYGLYFALARMRAQRYREMLAGAEYKIDGQDINEFRAGLERSVNEAKTAKEKKRLRERLEAFDEFYAHKNEADVKTAYEEGTVSKQAYKWFESEIRPKVKGQGHLYTAEIPDDNVLLREERTFDEQPKEVQDAIKNLFEKEFTAEQRDNFYREQWYNEAMEQMRDYTYEFEVPSVVLQALDKLAKEEGPQIFADEKKVLKKISKAINEAAEEKYQADKEWYEGQSKKEALKEIKEEIIEQGGLDADGLFYTILDVAESKYPSLLTGESKFEITDSLRGRDLYTKIAEFVGGEKEASELLNKYGVKGIFVIVLALRTSNPA